MTFDVCKLNNETGNVAFDLATTGGAGLGEVAEEHVICLQYEFDLARVIWMRVAIVFCIVF